MNTLKHLNLEEINLWNKATCDVIPLNNKNIAKNCLYPKKISTFTSNMNTNINTNPVTHIGKLNTNRNTVNNHQSSISDLNMLTHGYIANVDKRTGKRFRSGKMIIDSYIDLHGYNRKEAYTLLYNFIIAKFHIGKRCLLVITGKGLYPSTGGRGGVLRQSIPYWLNEPKIRMYILAFTYAKPHDGGEGALYVLLKRSY